MKIQKKVTEVSMIEIDIDLPFYSKNDSGTVAYAILSEKKSFLIICNDSEYNPYYSITNAESCNVIDNAMSLPACTKEEFESLRDSIVNKSNLS